MAVRIAIENQQSLLPIPPVKIRRILRTILQHEHVRQAELSIVFMTDKAIHRINKQFLGHDYPTDVITFDLNEVPGPNIDGEILISTMTARRQSRLHGTTPFYELVLYLVHGILHLLGYDDRLPRDVSCMRRKEQEIMRALKMVNEN